MTSARRRSVISRRGVLDGFAAVVSLAACGMASAGAIRSLTLVRLATGEVGRNVPFWRDGDRCAARRDLGCDGGAARGRAWERDSAGPARVDAKPLAKVLRRDQASRPVVQEWLRLDPFSATGLPLGIQIGGCPFEEATILRVAHVFQQATSWHT